MANKKVKHSDIIEDSVFNGTIEGATLLLKKIHDLRDGFKELSAEKIGELSLISPKSLASIDHLNTSLNESAVIRKRLNELELVEQKLKQQQLKTFQAEIKAEGELNKTLTTQQKLNQDKNKVLAEQEKLKQAKLKTLDAELKVESSLNKSLAEQEKIKQAAIKTLNDELKLEAAFNKLVAAEAKETERKNKALRDSQREYLKLSKQLTEQKNKVKDLLASEKELTKEDHALIKATQELDAKLKRIDKTVGDNQRSVGGYKDAIKEAISETGLFGGTLGTIINVFNKYGTATDEAGKKSIKFSGLAKAGLIGLAVAAAASLKALLELDQVFNDFTEREAAKAKDGLNGSTAFLELTNATIKYRKELRLLQQQQQSAALDEVDQNEIAADLTISLTERNAALKEAIRLSEVKAKINVLIAQQEFDLADKEVKAREIAFGQGSATNDLLDTRKEKQLALNDALDQESDLERINAERKRKLAQEEIINNIELLRSNKLSANAKVVALEKAFNDEKNQLEERRKTSEKINAQNIKVQNEEFAIFQAGVKEKIDVQKLLSIQDEVQLKNYVRKNIASIEGTALETELFKIIKQSQDARMANDTRLTKLQEEEIKNTQKILEINRDISKLVLEDKVRDNDVALQQKISNAEKINEKLQVGENVFNRDLLRKRNAAAQDIQGLTEQEAIQKELLLRSNAENDKIAIENTVFDEKVKAAELKRINEKLKIDLGNLETESFLKHKELSDKKLEEDKAIALKQRTIISDNLIDIGALTNTALEAKSQKNLDALDRETEKREENIDIQERLAEKGLNNSLAFERQKRDEAELEKEKQKEKDVKRAKVITYFNLLAEYAKNDPNSAPFKALAQTLIAETIAGAFKDGVEDFQGKGTEKSDSNLIRFSNHESVITAKGTKDNPGLATAMNTGNVGSWINENMSKLAIDMPVVGVQNTSTSAEIKELRQLNQTFSNEIKDLKQVVRESKSVTRWDEHGNMVVSEVIAGNKRVTKFMKARPRI